MSARIHLIVGDEYLATTKAKALVATLVDNPEDQVSLDVIDGQCDATDKAVDSVGRCLEALTTLGFFGGRKAVWFRGVSFLTDTVAGRTERTKVALGRLADCLKKGLPPEVGLVITTGQIDKRYALYKALAQVGEIHDVSLGEKRGTGPDPLRTILEQALQQAGIQITGEAREAFLARMGSDARTLVSEVSKLVAYLGRRTSITVQDVEAVTSFSRDAVSWDIQDAFGRREIGSAMAIMRRLLFQRESGVALISLLEARIRDLIAYREALDRQWVTLGGRDPAWQAMPPEGESMLTLALGKSPRTLHPFRLKLLLEQARRFSMAELRACQRAALKAHQQLVTTSLPTAYVLDMLLLTANPRRPAARASR